MFKLFRNNSFRSKGKKKSKKNKAVMENSGEPDSATDPDMDNSEITENSQNSQEVYPKNEQEISDNSKQEPIISQSNLDQYQFQDPKQVLLKKISNSDLFQEVNDETADGTSDEETAMSTCRTPKNSEQNSISEQSTPIRSERVFKEEIIVTKSPDEEPEKTIDQPQLPIITQENPKTNDMTFQTNSEQKPEKRAPSPMIPGVSFKKLKITNSPLIKKLEDDIHEIEKQIEQEIRESAEDFNIDGFDFKTDDEKALDKDNMIASLFFSRPNAEQQSENEEQEQEQEKKEGKLAHSEKEYHSDGNIKESQKKNKKKHRRMEVMNLSMDSRISSNNESLQQAVDYLESKLSQMPNITPRTQGAVEILKKQQEQKENSPKIEKTPKKETPKPKIQVKTDNSPQKSSNFEFEGSYTQIMLKSKTEKVQKILSPTKKSPTSDKQLNKPIEEVEPKKEEETVDSVNPESDQSLNDMNPFERLYRDGALFKKKKQQYRAVESKKREERESQECSFHPQISKQPNSPIALDYKTNFEEKLQKSAYSPEKMNKSDKSPSHSPELISKRFRRHKTDQRKHVLAIKDYDDTPKKKSSSINSPTSPPQQKIPEIHVRLYSQAKKLKERKEKQIEEMETKVSAVHAPNQKRVSLEEGIEIAKRLVESNKNKELKLEHARQINPFPFAPKIGQKSKEMAAKSQKEGVFTDKLLRKTYLIFDFIYFSTATQVTNVYQVLDFVKKENTDNNNNSFMDTEKEFRLTAKRFKFVENVLLHFFSSPKDKESDLTPIEAILDILADELEAAIELNQGKENTDLRFNFQEFIKLIETNFNLAEFSKQMKYVDPFITMFDEDTQKFYGKPTINKRSEELVPKFQSIAKHIEDLYMGSVHRKEQRTRLEDYFVQQEQRKCPFQPKLVSSSPQKGKPQNMNVLYCFKSPTKAEKEATKNQENEKTTSQPSENKNSPQKNGSRTSTPKRESRTSTPKHESKKPSPKKESENQEKQKSPPKHVEKEQTIDNDAIVDPKSLHVNIEDYYEAGDDSPVGEGHVRRKDHSSEGPQDKNKNGLGVTSYDYYASNEENNDNEENSNTSAPLDNRIEKAKLEFKESQEESSFTLNRDISKEEDATPFEVEDEDVRFSSNSDDKQTPKPDAVFGNLNPFADIETPKQTEVQKLENEAPITKHNPFSNLVEEEKQEVAKIPKPAISIPAPTTTIASIQMVTIQNNTESLNKNNPFSAIIGENAQDKQALTFSPSHASSKVYMNPFNAVDKQTAVNVPVVKVNLVSSPKKAESVPISKFEMEDF